MRIRIATAARKAGNMVRTVTETAATATVAPKIGNATAAEVAAGTAAGVAAGTAAGTAGRGAFEEGATTRAVVRGRVTKMR